jgi:ornithine cyclodeaminase
MSRAVYFDAERIAEVLAPPVAEAAVGRAFAALASGSIVAPARQALFDGRKVPVVGIMPGVAGDLGLAGVKLAGLLPQAGHSGLMVVYSMETGRIVATLDASSLTAIRTAAASAVATRLLVRAEPKRLAILGSGTQARAHVAHFARAFALDSIAIWSRTAAHAEALATAAESFGVAASVHDSAGEAVAGADVICTLTRATEPILNADDLPAAVHLNLVGSSFAHAREVDAATVARGRYYVDSVAAAREQAGEFRAALAEGVIGDDHIAGELGDIVTGKVAGRTDAAQTTIFKSLGSIGQDLYAAAAVIDAGRA